MLTPEKKKKKTSLCTYVKFKISLKSGYKNKLYSYIM